MNDFYYILSRNNMFYFCMCLNTLQRGPSVCFNTDENALLEAINLFSTQTFNDLVKNTSDCTSCFSHFEKSRTNKQIFYHFKSCWTIKSLTGPKRWSSVYVHWKIQVFTSHVFRLHMGSWLASKLVVMSENPLVHTRVKLKYMWRMGELRWPWELNTRMQFACICLFVCVFWSCGVSSSGPS